MTETDEQTVGTPLFPAGYRASGLLLHVTSLPSPYGIGDIGPGALKWIDRLHDAGQGWWQALPLGPTGYGDSPYQSLSSFAGNGLLISPEGLIEDGLLNSRDCQAQGLSDTAVQYGPVISFKHRLLKTVWRGFVGGNGAALRPAFEEFCRAQACWLDDYSLFRALKVHHNGAHYLTWPREIVRREPDALARVRIELAATMDQVRFAQFLLARQASRLRDHARARGVRLIGDLPFFVSPDSSDVWAHPELFLLDEQYRPRVVAGVPPDYFSPTGQLWGNPIYNWDALRSAGFRWCIDRLKALLVHVDVVRLDHFRAFAAAWHVPAGTPTAQTGAWVPGPGAAFFGAVEKELGALPFIAEDLGLITPDVIALRDQLQVPGTKVLQFAFDGSADNPFLPANFGHNTVVYTGTHDNDTTRGWYDSLTPQQKRLVWDVLRRPEGRSEDAAPALTALAWHSKSALTIAPFQDLLNLGSEARMNVPGRADRNWRWRCTPAMLSDRLFTQLRDDTAAAGRSSLAPRA